MINQLYCMDNLELLEKLPDESIDLIYCDILYNTGKKFEDYDDRLGTSQEAIQWYEPRLKEMRRVLKSTGSIYLHCDYRLVHYLKVKMDELFDEDQFRNDIIWCYGAGGRNKRVFSRKHDNILFYSKTDDYAFNLLIDESTGQVCKDYWHIKNIAAKSGFLRPKGDNETILYSTQKPKELLKRVIEASSKEGDVVADFFCGSGTTIVVAKELGRQYIGCDINPKAIEITKQRLEETLIHGTNEDNEEGK